MRLYFGVPFRKRYLCHVKVKVIFCLPHILMNIYCVYAKARRVNAYLFQKYRPNLRGWISKNIVKQKN